MYKCGLVKLDSAIMVWPSKTHLAV